MLWSLLLFFPVAFSQRLPRYPPHHSHACLPPADTFPFCNVSLPIPSRVADLISRLTLAQKIANRYDLEVANPALGLDQFNYNQEGLHGLGAICFRANASTPVRCPTVFAAPPSLASSFNASLLLAVGDGISTEARAYNNFGGNRGYANRPVDLQVWLPNVNIARDARWGRQVETYSEDAWLTGQLGAAIVEGAMRGADGGASGNGYLKLFVAVKHATAYQIENNRFGRNVNITPHDLSDTYYPAWEGAIEQGKASGVMCAYPSVNGVPCCGDEKFLNGLLRGTFGMGGPWGGGSYVQGDCGAIENIYSRHHYVGSMPAAAATALNAGADVDCGSGFPNNLMPALLLNLTTEAVLDESLTRTYTLQMLAGRFDPLAAQPYASIPFEAIGAPEQLATGFESAVQGMVLLRNDKGLLPLRGGARLAVVGPLGNSTSLAGNYFEEICPDGSQNCVPTLLAAVAGANGGAGATAFAQGCTVSGGDASGIPAAAAAAAAADVVILALGTDGSVCGEGNDRADASLPGKQAALAAAVLAAGKPTVLVLFNGQTVAIDSILAGPAGGAPLAIVEAWNPGTVGGAPVAAALFGAVNRWGKLPVTWMANDFYGAVAITDMSMVPLAGGYPGRTCKF